MNLLRCIGSKKNKIVSMFKSYFQKIASNEYLNCMFIKREDNENINSLRNNNYKQQNVYPNFMDRGTEINKIKLSKEIKKISKTKIVEPDNYIII